MSVYRPPTGAPSGKRPSMNRSHLPVIVDDRKILRQLWQHKWLVLLVLLTTVWAALCLSKSRHHALWDQWLIALVIAISGGYVVAIAITGLFRRPLPSRKNRTGSTRPREDSSEVAD